MKKTKIGIIGIGNVGAHVLYTLALQGLAQEFLLIDIDEKKAGADLQDVFDCAMYLPHPVRMSVGTFSDLKDCDIIVYSVGKIDLLRQGHNRLTELNFNIPAAIENARKIKESGFTGILINISNPRYRHQGTGKPAWASKGSCIWNRNRTGYGQASCVFIKAHRYRCEIHYGLYAGRTRKRSVYPMVLCQLSWQTVGGLG